MSNGESIKENLVAVRCPGSIPIGIDVIQSKGKRDGGRGEEGGTQQQ